MFKNHYNFFSLTLVQSLAFYSAIAVLLLTLYPYNFQLNIEGAFSWDYDPSDAFANLALTWPLGFFLVLARKKYLPIHLAIDASAGLLLSLLVETGQLFLDERASQYGDVICNSIGIIIGALTGVIIKPIFNRQLVNITDSTLVILGTLCLLSILILIRLASDEQGFGFFEVLLLFCSTTLIALIFNRYAYYSRETVFFQTNIFSTIYVFIVGSPLLTSNTMTLLVACLVTGLFTPIMTVRTERASYTSYRIRQNLLLIITTASMATLFFIAWIHLNSSQSQIQFLSYEYGSHSTSHQVLGAIIAETILPYIIFIQLINCFLIHLKKPIRLKAFIYSALLIAITTISFTNIANYNSKPTQSFVYLILLLLTFILFFSNVKKPKNLE